MKEIIYCSLLPQRVRVYSDGDTRAVGNNVSSGAVTKSSYFEPLVQSREKDRDRETGNGVKFSNIKAHPQ